MADFPHRGDVFRVNLDPTVGREIHKTRPAVIISNDHMNELAPTVLVMPITTGRHAYFHQVPLDPPEGGLSKPSTVITEQIRSLDKSRLRQRLGWVRPETMARLEQAFRDHCGLPESDVEPADHDASSLTA